MLSFFKRSGAPSAALFGGLLLSATCVAAGRRPAAPEFPERPASQWINSEPLTLESLRGHVVLLDFWTFECWNCYRSFPWLHELEARFQDQGLRVIGVHTPEFEREKVVASIRAKVQEFGIEHPVMIDSDHAYWNALQNRYWPAWYLIDRQGRIAAVYAGEVHSGDRQAKAIEADIQELLAASNDP
jgi:thiol-disulfide isomerase/thioredoxin